MGQTKGELLKKNKRLNIINVSLKTELGSVKAEKVLDNERIRKEFAKAFNWMKDKTYKDISEPKTPTWEEIFVQVGKLLNQTNEVDRIKYLEDTLSTLRDEFNNLIYKLEQKQ